MSSRTNRSTGSGDDEQKKPAPRRAPAQRKPAAKKPAAKTSTSSAKTPPKTRAKRTYEKSPTRLEREANPRGRSTPALGKGKSKTERQVDAAERAKKALQLRTMRVSYDIIAKQCGYASRGAAYTAVKRELSRIPREAAKELRVSELETLDTAQRALASRIANGDLGAVDRMLKIMDMRARLTGMYDEIVDTGVDEVRGVLAAWMGQVAKQVELDELEDAEREGDDDADD